MRMLFEAPEEDVKIRVSGRSKGWKPFIVLTSLLCLTVLILGAAAIREQGTGYKITGWNNLGMHCMDADFSVLSLLPPYNTIEAQVIDPEGNLVTDTSGLTVTYEGIADPDGSINTTSQGKTNFWNYITDLFGVTLPVDQGLVGKNMPGPSNPAQAMTFVDPDRGLFRAEGIPITPNDDAGGVNPYPLMRLKVKNAAGNVLAFCDIVLPVSTEMECALCHVSGGPSAAMPSAGWVNDPVFERDYRLNILRLHDEHASQSGLYAPALAAGGFNSDGLYQTVISDGKAVLCASCHASEALPGSGYEGIPQLTTSIHSLHGGVVDPTNGLPLDSVANRSACYRCHPGSETRCLRGAMANAVAADGTLSIQCQDCHGLMSAVGSPDRTGWLMEPTCQQCHTGTAVQNNGQIRYDSVFTSQGQPRIPVNATFATNPDSPAAGLSLYRFSYGHGGIQCSGCHGSTHAEFPSSHRNDNIHSIAFQGHAGTISECVDCHGTMPQTVDGGPHGMHPVGQEWVERHHDVADENQEQCKNCHGLDYRGTVLSRALGERSLDTDFGTKNFWRGFTVGCYTCHNGPDNEDMNPNRAPVASGTSAATSAGQPVPVALSASDPDGNPLVLRIVNQPSGGTAGLVGSTATYFPFPGFSGTDIFTFAASDGSTESNLASVTITVGGTGCTFSCGAAVPTSGVVGQSVTFTGISSSQGCSGSPSFNWNFGDGGISTAQSPTHIYNSPGTYTWSLLVSQDGQTCAETGTIIVDSTGGNCVLTCRTEVPTMFKVNEDVEFKGNSTSGNCSGTPVYMWNLGDGTTSSRKSLSHKYSATGTYFWTFTVTQGGQVCVKSGSITIYDERPDEMPVIDSIVKRADPFRVVINGHNCKEGVAVYLGSDTVPWNNLKRKTEGKVLLGNGKALKDKFPKGIPVVVRVVNPDGGMVQGVFTR